MLLYDTQNKKKIITALVVISEEPKENKNQRK